MKVAFKMKLYPGGEAEYKKRHDEIWPELEEVLRAHGISDYAIFHDPETGILFGVQELGEDASPGDLPLEPVMRRWWDHMADLMETHPDHSPVTGPLTQVFYMP